MATGTAAMATSLDGFHATGSAHSGFLCVIITQDNDADDSGSQRHHRPCRDLTAETTPASSIRTS